MWKVEDDRVEAEKARLLGAVTSVTENLSSIQQELAGAIGKQDVRIYDAQMAILHDETFLKEIEGEIEQHKCNLEVALQRVVARYESVFEQMENAAMRERAADLRDIGRQLVGALVTTGRQIYTADGADYLFAADEFLPSDAGILDREHIRGIVTAHGGKYSHGAILARSLGIPAIVGVDKVMQETSNGALAILDGDAGVVLLDPKPDELADYERRLQEQRSVESRIAELRFQPSVTPDGTKVRLMANAESVQDVARLELGTMAGIGLFRTEFAFMERRQFPTEEEQVSMYRRAVEIADGKPVTFRALDVGGDKPLGYFKMPDERNPVLGWRGIRLCLDWPDILYTQLRAILRASAEGHVRIMLPMVTTRSEVVRCREVLDQLTADLRANNVAFDPRIEFGVMVEVPVMVSVLPEILPVVDFVSVGTNDLVQYLLAVDRDNQRVAKMYDPFHPGVLRVLAQISKMAIEAGKSASICGEIAGDHWFTPVLLGLGYRELSMAPVFLPRVKLMLRSFSLEECRVIARRALSLHSTSAVRKMIHSEVLPRWSEQLRGSDGSAAEESASS